MVSWRMSLWFRVMMMADIPVSVSLVPFVLSAPLCSCLSIWLPFFFLPSAAIGASNHIPSEGG